MQNMFPKGSDWRFLFVRTGPDFSRAISRWMVDRALVQTGAGQP